MMKKYLQPAIYIVAIATTTVGAPLAVKAELPYGANTCIEGYVWREATPNDYVCVTPEVREQVQRDNAQAHNRKQPGGGAYGLDTCIQGYVWREATPVDHVCVLPEIREQAKRDNSQAQARFERNKPTY